MKRLIILTVLIAVFCAVKQQVSWPEPGFTGASTDPLETFTFDSTLTLKPLDSTDIVILDSMRLAYYHAVKDSFPDMGWRWWTSSVRSWIQYHIYDSLRLIGVSPTIYYYHLLELRDQYYLSLGVYSKSSLHRYLYESEELSMDSAQTMLNIAEDFWASIGYIPKPFVGVILEP